MKRNTVLVLIGLAVIAISVSRIAGCKFFHHCAYAWIPEKNSTLQVEDYVCPETGEEVGSVYLNPFNDRWHYYFNNVHALALPDMGERFSKEDAKRIVEKDAR